MEPVHAARKVDELGRIVLPSELRKKLDWSEGDSVSVIENDGTVILKLFERCRGPKCVFCGTAEAAKIFKGYDICGDCLAKIKTT
jgi:transcriptional pleiotropic regulator of transition state genes